MTTSTATLNGRPPLCEVAGCGARVHGSGLCRIHYDCDRYLRATGRSPEALAEVRRERSIDDELCLGGVAERESPHGTNSMFASDHERREAWEARRSRLLSRYLTRRFFPASDPAPGGVTRLLDRPT